ncbi:MAG: hypothetical protein LBT39_09260 [Treponema sp.]|jgi:hypothetical protein|nr:hypothetical protein [Treponema sp.]
MFPPFRFFSAVILFLLLSLTPVFSSPGLGVSSAAAEQYLLLAEQLTVDGRWDEALVLLERGGDFADVSSDISYLLAQARFHENMPLRSVLEALRRAFGADRWEHYSPAPARLLEAEVLIRLRSFSEALRALTLAEQNPGPGIGPDADLGADAAILRLLALKGIPDLLEFRRFLGVTMDRYPRDPRPVEILFSWARDRLPDDRNAAGAPTDRTLIDLALRRFPLLVEISPRLGYLAAPFVRDLAEARRLLSAYRALGKAEKESLPVCLDLGIIDEWQAVEELFDMASDGLLDRDLILRVWSLLRNREGRNFFRQYLLRFSGMITGDLDRDGYYEARTRYVNGTPQEYYWDADQDRLAELHISFSSGGTPVSAEQESEQGQRIFIRWERYPAVLQAELDGIVYVPRPEDFFFTPIRFSELTGGGGEPGLLYPETENTRLTQRTLVSFALTIIRPSREFSGGFEHIELERGIPRRATEMLDNRIVAVTEFVLGRPRFQRLDLDLDGRMETIRRFREGRAADEADPLGYETILELVETDRDRDGLYEIGEQFLPDGTIIYSWDTNGDGVRDFFEERKRN